MTIETISLIVSAVGLAFLLFGMFWGIVRGFKKSLFRGIWLLCLAIIVFILTPTISSFIYNLDLSFLNINIEGEPLTSVFGMLNSYATTIPQVAEFLADYPQMILLVEKLLILIINVFVFTLSFWILKILTWPIWAIISGVIFRKKKIINDNKKIILRAKKHRFFGMLVGSVLGVFVLSMTLMPITGTINFARELDAEEFYGSDQGIITTYAGEDVMGYVDTVYSDSILGKVLEYSGINALTNTMYRHLTTTSVEGESISLTSEAKLYLELYNSLNIIRNTDFDNLTKESLNTFLNSSETIVKKLFSSSILTVAGDSVIPFALSYFEENETYTNFVGSITVPQLRGLVTEGYAKFKTSNVNTIQRDLLNVIYIAKSLNNADIVIPTINGTLEPMDYLDLVDDNLITEVTNYLFQMPSVAKIYPIALNKGLSYLGTMLGFTYTEQDFSNTALSAQDFSNILKGGLAVVKTLDFDSTYFVTNSSFEAVGGFLDIIRDLNFLQNNLFETIVGKLFDKGEDFINDLDNTTEVKTLLTTIVGKVENMVTNRTVTLKTEFRQYGTLFDDITLMVNNFSTTPLDELDLGEYGKMLDRLNNTYLFKNIMPDLINTGWALVKDSVTAALPAEFTEVESVVTTIKNNLIAILENQKLDPADRTLPTTNNTSLSLEFEFDNLQSIYDFINTNITTYFSTETGEDNLMDDLLGEGTLFTNFGKELDKLTTNHSLILTDNVVKSLVSQAFKMISTVVDDTTINTFVTTVSTNIKNSTATINWETEFGYFKSFGSFMGDSFTLSTVGSALDSLSRSSFITYSSINTLLSSYMQTQYDALDVADKTEFMESVYTQIKTNILTINSARYQTELEFVEDLMDLADTGSTDTYANIGATLDSFNSSVVVASVRKTLIKYVLDEKLTDVTLDSNALSFIQTIRTNADSIPSTVANNFYTVELGNLSTVLNLTIPSNEGDMTDLVLSGYGETFYEMSNSVLSYNLGDKIMTLLLDAIDTTDTHDYVVILRTNILGDSTNNITGILPANRKNSSLPSTTQDDYKSNYKKAFTELKVLTGILSDIENISDYTSYSTIGGYINTIHGLSIAVRPNSSSTGVDQKIASEVLNKLQTQITDELNTTKQEAIDEINSNALLTQAEKDAKIASINTYVSDASTSITSTIAVNQATVDGGVSDYSNLFTTLGTTIENILDSLETNLNSI